MRPAPNLLVHPAKRANLNLLAILEDVLILEHHVLSRLRLVHLLRTRQLV
jgi:hypothetical protein